MPYHQDRENLTPVRRILRAILICIRHGELGDEIDDPYNQAPYGFHTPAKWGILVRYLKNRYEFFDSYYDDIIFALQADTHYRIFYFDGKPYSVAVRRKGSRGGARYR